MEHFLRQQRREPGHDHRKHSTASRVSGSHGRGHISLARGDADIDGFGQRGFQPASSPPVQAARVDCGDRRRSASQGISSRCRRGSEKGGQSPRTVGSILRQVSRQKGQCGLANSSRRCPSTVWDWRIQLGPLTRVGESHLTTWRWDRHFVNGAVVENRHVHAEMPGVRYHSNELTRACLSE